MRLSECVNIRPRFARSANVERDVGVTAVDGYLLTGRALDVLARIARSLVTSSAGRAFAITGPHGGGKSSLAVFLNAVFASHDSVEHQAASARLQATDPELFQLLSHGLDTMDPAGNGAIRAFAAASHEPVTVTVARALLMGARRALGDSQTVVPAAFGDEETARNLTVREIRDVVASLCEIRPVVLVIDEFGKNLEAFASSGRDGDPYLLQWLAEASQGESALPLVIITMQHLAFDEYAQGASLMRRREWAKVQGRFQDVAYVETPHEARRLMAAALEVKPGPLEVAVSRWYEDHARVFAEAGLRELWASAQSCYPLHPLAVAALPELCSRYGQNERTLFSFMAGSEPLAVPAFLEATAWSDGNSIPFVGLNRVYDYFLDSSGTMISASTTASRWLEIETRLRDTTGLSAEQMHMLKSIGVLNLVSSSGALRASRRILELAAGAGDRGSQLGGGMAGVLSSLEAAGLITYRDFADEYRIWQGSDFDLEGTIAAARRACDGRNLADLLNSVITLDPAVAGRHSQRTGILRIFERRFSDLRVVDLVPPAPSDPWDGVVLYAAVTDLPDLPSPQEHDKPIVVAVPSNLDGVRDAAIEAAALRMALSSAQEGKTDWVARRELVERAAIADKAVREEVATAWGPATSTWYLIGRRKVLSLREGLSAILSRVADIAYHLTPHIANEMIARRELTSQGAKARRILLEAFLENLMLEQFGIKGYGPERAIYEAVYRATGIHRLDKRSGRWTISEPTGKNWASAWAEIVSVFQEAKFRRIGLLDACERLKRPPIGLKDGILPVLLVTALVRHANEIALYEHGSLTLNLDDAVAERLTRNPGQFSIKNSASGTAGRMLVIREIAKQLGITNTTGQPTFLQVARSLYRDLRLLTPFGQQTRRYVSERAAAVRQAFKTAAEPDTLIFETLPDLLDRRPFLADSKVSDAEAKGFATDLGEVVGELRGAYPRLLEEIWDHLAEATATWGEQDDIRTVLAAQAVTLEGRVLEPRLGAFAAAMRRPLEGEAWIENVAMVVTGGQAPRTWTDELAERFVLLVADLGGAFRRVQALLYGRLAASDEGYRSRRLTVTRPDGRERSQVLTLSERDRTVVKKYLDPVVERLTAVYGSRVAACQTLLAHLATEDSEVSNEVEVEDLSTREA